jgi:hypothetical protein
MSWVSDDAETRHAQVEAALREAFASFVESRPTDVIVFSSVSAADLAAALQSHPLVLKPLAAACNIAARAIERDLGIRDVDTYKPRLTPEQAAAIAGYLKPFLPPYMEIFALSHLDRTAFVDKEIRKAKGNWEKGVTAALNRFSSMSFKKRMFRCGSEKFELDAASPLTGTIEIGVDVKRVEARRDIHKRCDEIVNKAARLKTAYPNARFAAVIYYPFIPEHANVKSRLESDDIDAVMFARESKESVEDAVKMLLPRLGAAK